MKDASSLSVILWLDFFIEYERQKCSIGFRKYELMLPYIAHMSLAARIKARIPRRIKGPLARAALMVRVFRFDVFTWLFLRGEKKYAYFQKKMYDYWAKQSNYTATSTEDHVVGTYQLQNEWQDYDDYIMRYVDASYTNKLAIDFATGPGRNIIKYSPRFKRLDGVDISAQNIENAKENIAAHGLPLPNLYVNNGIDLADVPSDTYDLVISTIALQHICVHKIRYSLFEEFYRVLKRGGRISLQMGYGSDSPNSVPYLANDYAALQTNGLHDTQVESPDLLSHDLEEIGFTNFEFWIRPSGPKSPQKEWIYFTATK